MISIQEYLNSIQLQIFTGSFISVDEAVFQSACSQYIFFKKLQPLLARGCGWFSRVTFHAKKLDLSLKYILSYYSHGGAEFDFSFILNREVLLVTSYLSVEDHQLIGEKIRLFMLEVIVVSAAIKEKHGTSFKLYKFLKRLYFSLFNLRNSIVEYLSNNPTINRDELYYTCSMSNITNSFTYQQSIVKSLSLEVDLEFYKNYLSNATRLSDFP